MQIGLRKLCLYCVSHNKLAKRRLYRRSPPLVYPLISM
jgi:hypothetical protein